jgi:arginine decarboxylase
MNKSGQGEPQSPQTATTLSQFFSAAEARVDRWRTLSRVAKTLGVAETAAVQRLRADANAVLSELAPLEELNGYPGPHLMDLLRERLDAGDRTGVARLVQRISFALMSNSYRDDTEAWAADENGDAHMPDVLPPSVGRGQSRKPYFEVLIVAAGERTTWAGLRDSFRRLRRDEDSFVYEPVVVGSFEDAVLAALVNFNLQSVVMLDGFAFPSHFDLPALHEILAPHVPADAGSGLADLSLALTRVLHMLRPELDLFMVTDRDVGALASSDEAAALRRVFYGVEEPMEIHLAVLDGIKDRYETPYFDNLKKYAARPIGTFHALPIARGKSIFKSNWIRDMGEFYGANLFLAESSATTGGLDSLLEPTGNIKVAQEKAARAFGGDRSFFVTNGTSTANKIVHQALLVPGDIVLIDRDCHKSHHYGAVLAGAQPLYIDAFPLTQYSMYGSLAIKPIKQALLQLKAEGKLDRAKMLVLTNCTFDGHIANVERTMLECLAIKPDLVFLWDEAWYGYARFSPFLRGRTAMGAAAKLRDMMHDPAYRKRYEKFKADGGSIDLKDRSLDSHLLPDPDRVRVRVYETESVHKSMSALRQGSIVVVADQDFHTVEAAFKEAFFTHTSTSPNLQIIASIDLARRQMELEGFELVQRAIQLAIEIRREINGHPLISKYFRAATPAEMIPEQYRKSGFGDYGMPGRTIADTARSLREDEFFLDPTRITLLCGAAGYDGTQFKSLLATEHDIQINKTSRNSVLVQININNTRSDMAHLMKALSDISRSIDKRLAEGGDAEHASFAARVKALVEDVPDLPDFSRFHDAFRDDPKSATAEGHMRSAYYMAYDASACEYLKLNDKAVDERLRNGPELVSAKFVIPYPPGFPIMVPGQVITPETIAFMRKLDVKEIHGFNAARGLELLKPDALASHKARASQP